MNYDKYMEIAAEYAEMSDDPSTQVGAVIINTRGDVHAGSFNHSVVVMDESKWERPGKYTWVEHAERAVIYKTAWAGYTTRGKIMVCTWAACADCARAIALSGISTLVTRTLPHGRWADSIAAGRIILEHHGVEVVEYG